MQCSAGRVGLAGICPLHGDQQPAVHAGRSRATRWPPTQHRQERCLARGRRICAVRHFAVPDRRGIDRAVGARGAARQSVDPINAGLGLVDCLDHVQQGTSCSSNQQRHNSRRLRMSMLKKTLISAGLLGASLSAGAVGDHARRTAAGCCGRRHAPGERRHCACRATARKGTGLHCRRLALISTRATERR